jgi:putative hydrolase
MRDYFVSLVEEGIGSLEPDPARFAEALKRMADEIRAGRNPLRENGALGLVATPEQLEGIQRIQALMSLLEGHGDVTMDRAGAAAIPSAARFAEVLRQRRKQVKGPARVLQQLIGLEAKLRQYEEGERFIEAVEKSGGPELLARAWRGPEWLPSLTEIRDPSAWVTRVGATHALSG